jgi:hypothetical protein
MADLLHQSLAQEGFALSTVQSGEEGTEQGGTQGRSSCFCERIRSAPASASRIRCGPSACSRLAAKTSTASWVWALAPTTICPNPSTCASWWLASILRRAGRDRLAPPNDKNSLELKNGSVSLDRRSRAVRRDRQIVASEFELLRVLMESAGALVSRQDRGGPGANLPKHAKQDFS